MTGEIVGRGKPPQSTRFQKGRSGNPRGRPRGRHRSIPYDHVLGRMVTIREDGRERRITAAEAFLLQLTKKGLEGCSASARSSLQVIEQARASRPELDKDRISGIVVRYFGLSCVVEDLRIGICVNATSDEHCRLMLSPWIVEMALAKMAPDKLSLEEQHIVLASTRTPHKVRWPDWWVAHST
jgi:hypothetical protein